MPVLPHHTTKVGRVVYDRKPHEFKIKDAARILSRLSSGNGDMVNTIGVVLHGIRLLIDATSRAFFGEGLSINIARNAMQAFLEGIDAVVTFIAETFPSFKKEAANQLRALANYLDPLLK